MQETLTNTTESPSDPIISVKSLWKIFGNNQDEIVNLSDLFDVLDHWLQ